MKTPIWVYVAIVVLSVGAGVAIAGIPDTSAREPTIVPPETTAVVDTLPEPEPTPETTVPPESTVAATTVAPETTTTSTPVLELPERDEVEVAVANGAGIGGVAGDTAEFLDGLGYTNTVIADGTTVESQTFIYADAEFNDFAQRLSDDMGLPGGRVLERSSAPDTAPAVDSPVLLYAGEDIELVIG